MFNHTICARLAIKQLFAKQIPFSMHKAVSCFSSFQMRMMNMPANQYMFKSTNLSFKTDNHRMYVYVLPPTCDHINQNQYQIGVGSAIALTFYPNTSQTLQENSYEQRKSYLMNCKEVLQLLKMKPRLGKSLLQTNQYENDEKTYTIETKTILIRAGQCVLKNQIEEPLWDIQFGMNYTDFRVLQQHFKDNLGFITGAQMMLEFDKEKQLHIVDTIPYKKKEK